MKSNKKLLLAGIAGVLLLVMMSAAAFAVGAQTSSRSSFTETIAKKLNVSTDKVNAALTEMQQERQAERQAAIEETLAAAVKNGTITDPQRDTILAKLAEIQKKQAEVAKLNDEFRQWADDNEIDLSSLIGGFGRRGRGMRGGPGLGGGGPPGVGGGGFGGP